MKLASKFKDEILEGKAPALSVDENPDIKQGQVVVIEYDNDRHPTIWIKVLHRSKTNLWAYSIHWFQPDYMGKTNGVVHRPSQAFSIRDGGGYEPERTDGDAVVDFANEALRHERRAEHRARVAARERQRRIDKGAGT